MMKRNQGASSCLLIGCIGAVIVVVGGVAAVVIGGRIFLNKIIEQYTDDAPMVFEEVTLTEEDYQEVSDRIQAFATALEEGTETEPLELTAEEINSALLYESDFSEFAQYFRVSIEEGYIAGSLSLPLGDFELPFSGLEGRYLNGKGVFDVYIRDGLLSVHIKSFEVKGESIPEEFMSEIGQTNMATEIDKDGETRDTVRKLEAIEIGDGLIRIIAKPADERPVGESSAEETLEEVDV